MLDNIVYGNLTPLLIAAAGVLIALSCFRRPSGLPPGPVPIWPLVGNIFQMEANPTKKFRYWSKKYGDIFSLYMGNRLVIVLNGYDVLKEALVKYGEEFSYRPNIFIFEAISKFKGIAGTSGVPWKEQRRFALSTLKDFGLGRRMLEDKIMSEVLPFLKSMEDHNGHKFDITEVLSISVANVICAVVFGRRFEYDDVVFKEYLVRIDENFRMSTDLAVLSFFPFTRYLPGDLFSYKKIMDNVDFIDNKLILPMVNDHRRNYDENNINDFLYAYIKEQKTRRENGTTASFTDDNLTTVVRDLLVAGTETTSTTIRWAVLYFITYPEVQEKCFQDVQKAIGVKRMPTMADKLKMPYMEATITEIQRLANIVPIAGFRAVSHTLQFRGYTIPKDAIIIPNLASVLLDPEIFEDPEELRPERFLDADGNFCKDVHSIPFSFGKRNCIGESMAKMELFLFLTTMIQQFRFEKADDEDMPCLTAVPGTTFTPKPYKIVAKYRA